MTCLKWTGTCGALDFFLQGRLCFVTGDAGGRRTLDGDQAWSLKDGCYLFLPKEMELDAALLQRMEKLCQLYGERRFLFWLKNPEDSSALWRYEHLACRSGSDGKRILDGEGCVRLQRYTAVLDAGTSFDLVGGRIALRTDSLRFFLPGGAAMAEPSEENRAIAFIALDGSNAGCLEFTCILKKRGKENGLESPMELLDAGLRYAACIPQKDNSQKLCSLTSQLLSPCGDLKLSVSLDPSLPPNQSGRLAFEEGARFDCALRTIRGGSMRLTALQGAGLVFNESPSFLWNENGSLRGNQISYLTYEGSFLVEPCGTTEAGVKSDGTDRQAGDFDEAGQEQAGQMVRLLCGTAGTEYIGFSSPLRITFHPGFRAFCDQEGVIPLTDLASTAWISVSGSTQPEYFTQPGRASLFGGSEAPQNVLPFLELSAGRIAPDRSFPLLPSSGLTADGGASSFASVLEERCIRPIRTELLLKEGNCIRGNGSVRGVTPQGILAEIEGAQWRWLGVANTDGADPPDVRFTELRGAFRLAMQREPLFLAVADPGKLMEYASVPYCLSTDRWDRLKRDAPAYLQLWLKLRPMIGEQFENEAAFSQRARSLSEPLPEEAEQALLRECGRFTFTAEDWNFQGAPRGWYRGEEGTDQRQDENTLLILKYTDCASIDALMDAPALWGFPEGAGNAAAIYKRSLGCCYDEKGVLMKDYEGFVELARDPGWRGTLILNCPVAVQELPPEVRFLIEGIQGDQLRAHHVGVQAGGVSQTDALLRMEGSSLFGLVDYREPVAGLNRLEVAVDQWKEVHVQESAEITDATKPDGAKNAYGEKGDFDFVTTRLTVQIRNSMVQQFSSSSELYLGQLFGVTCRIHSSSTGGRVILDGSSQKADGRTVYQFALRERVNFLLEKGLLESVEMTSASLSCAETGGAVSGMFRFAGNLRFVQQTDCDILSYGCGVEPEAAQVADGMEAKVTDGYLAFGGLLLSMDQEGQSCGVEKRGSACQRFGVASPKFSLRYDALSFDEQKSVARPASLVAQFPLRPSALLHGKAGGLEGLGYRSITCPLQQDKIEGEWFALEWELPLGSLGANSGGEGLSLSLLEAWETAKPENTGENKDVETGMSSVFVGIRFPGQSQGGAALQLQGFLELSFKAIELSVFQRESGREYQFRLRNFALRVLGLAFPPGKNDVLLFGGSGRKLGWYAALSDGSTGEKGG